MPAMGFDDDGHLVPIEFITPEDRCACLEERRNILLNMGLQPEDIDILIAHSNDLKDLQ